MAVKGYPSRGGLFALGLRAMPLSIGMFHGPRIGGLVLGGTGSVEFTGRPGTLQTITISTERCTGEHS